MMEYLSGLLDWIGAHAAWAGPVVFLVALTESLALVGLIVPGALLMFLWELRNGTSVQTARTMAVNAIVVAEMFCLLNNRFLLKPVLNWSGLFGNRVAFATVVACVLLTALFTYAPVMNATFDTTPLGLLDWVKAAGVGAVVFGAVELEKAVVRRYRAARGTTRGTN